MYANVNAKTGSMIEGGFFQFRFAQDAAHQNAIEYKTDVNVVRQDRNGQPTGRTLYTASAFGGFTGPDDKAEHDNEAACFTDQRNADFIDDYDRDDLGESPDF